MEIIALLLVIPFTIVLAFILLIIKDRRRKQGRDNLPSYQSLVPISLVVSIILAIPFSSDFQNLFYTPPKMSDKYTWAFVHDRAWEGFNILSGQYLEFDVSEVKEKYEDKATLFAYKKGIDRFSIVMTKGELAYEIVGSGTKPKVFKTDTLTRKTFLDPMRSGGGNGGPVLIDSISAPNISPGQKIRIWPNTTNKNERVLGYIIFLKSYHDSPALIDPKTDKIILRHPANYHWKGQSIH
jgi:hypothetical protein